MDLEITLKKLVLAIGHENTDLLDEALQDLTYVMAQDETIADEIKNLPSDELLIHHAIQPIIRDIESQLQTAEADGIKEQMLQYYENSVKPYLRTPLK